MAKDLYTSPLFKLRRAYAERFCDEWWIQSAKYHIIHPCKIVEPYDKVPPGNKAEYHSWSLSCMSDLGWYYWEYGRGWESRMIVEFHSGEAYWRELEELLSSRGVHVSVPTRGMAIGQQLQWYKDRLMRPIVFEKEYTDHLPVWIAWGLDPKMQIRRT